MGDQGFVTRGIDLEMQMCGAPWVPGGGLQQLPNRPIVRDGVGHGQDGFEVKAPLRIRCEFAPRLVLLPVGVLHVVKAFLIGLPNLDLCMGHSFALHTFYAALNLAGLTLGPVSNIVAQGVMRCVVDMEGPEHRGLGADVWFIVVHDHRFGSGTRCP